MRLLTLISIITLAFSLSFASTAQDKAASSKTIDENQPIEDTAKPSGEERSEKIEAEDENFDLDSFFKQGEENAKNGSSCEAPPEPIS